MSGLLILVFLYLITVVISYLFFRQMYKLEKDDAQYNPHGMAVIFMLIPFFNVAISFMLMIEAWLKNFEFNYEIDYKKFFRLK